MNVFGGDKNAAQSGIGWTVRQGAPGTNMWKAPNLDDNEAIFTVVSFIGILSLCDGFTFQSFALFVVILCIFVDILLTV